MSYTQINARITDQTLQLTNLPLLASGGVDEIRISCEFCSLWSGYAKTAVFYREGGPVYHAIMGDDAVVIPWEVMVDAGTVYFGILGSAGSSTRTTEVVQLTVTQGAISANAIEPAKPTPDIYSQLITRLNTLLAMESAGGAMTHTLSDEYISGTIATNGASARIAFTISKMSLTGGGSHYTDYCIKPELAPLGPVEIKTSNSDINVTMETANAEGWARMLIENVSSSFYDTDMVTTCEAYYPLASVNIPEVVDIRAAYGSQVYDTAGEAVRDIWNVAYKSLPITWVEDYYINGNTGETAANASLYASDYIDISDFAGQPIEIVCRMAGNVGFAFYDNSKRYISGACGNTTGASGEDVTTKTEVPGGAAFLRISAGYRDRGAAVRPFPSVNYALSCAKQILKFSDIPLTWVDGYYIRGENGAAVANADLCATDYIDISDYAGLPLEIVCRVGGAIGFAFYNKEKVYLAGESGESLGTTNSHYKTTYTAPVDAAYIRLTNYPSYKVSSYVKPVPDMQDILEAKNLAGTGTGGQRVFERKIAMFGDSITWGRNGDVASSTESGYRTVNTIPGTISKMLDVECDNHGVSSMGFIAEGSGMNAYEKISSTDLTGYDTVIICLGVNDHSKTLGAWDATAEDTVMGQFHKIVNYIYTQLPSARVIVIGPFNGRNAGTFPKYWYGQPWGEIETLLQTACDYYGLPYISQKGGPINAFTIQTLIGADGVHPSEEGYKRLGEWIAGELARYIG